MNQKIRRRDPIFGQRSVHDEFRAWPSGILSCTLSSLLCGCAIRFRSLPWHRLITDRTLLSATKTSCPQISAVVAVAGGKNMFHMCANALNALNAPESEVLVLCRFVPSVLPCFRISCTVLLRSFCFQMTLWSLSLYLISIKLHWNRPMNIL